jgi:transcription-repair coupling factor (superfamily II helicase)
VELLIPDEYVSNTQERLNLYTELNEVTDEAGIESFGKKLEDRFGKIPKPVNALFEALRLQWSCKKLGFERLILKSGKLRCYFIGDPQSSFFETATFNKIMLFVQQKGRPMGISLKQTNKELIFVQDEVRSLKTVKSTLEQVLGFVGENAALKNPN